jgi:hypothetical protein
MARPAFSANREGLPEPEWQAHVAQLAEHILGKDEVSGSIPLMGSAAATNAKKQ